MDRLMEKLALSKAIMDKADGIKGTNSMNGGLPLTSLQQMNSPESFEIPTAKYNIPAEFLQESNTPQQPYLSNVPRENTKPVGVPTVDAIKNSKLPDEIKRLMMEHPIQQPTMGTATGSVLSDELVEKASRLMNTNAKGDVVRESKTTQRPQKQESLDMSGLKDLIRETMEDVLHENGLLVESESKSSDVFKFRVGQHIFEGKVTKIRKIAK